MEKLKRLTTLVGLIAGLLAPIQASAADSKKVTGGVLIAAGSALVLGAFNWGTSCPPGYTTHTFQNLPTQCVYISSSGNSDVREASTTADYRRPALMWSGVGAAGAGIVFLLLPDRVTKSVGIAITPTGWMASKAFEF